MGEGLTPGSSAIVAVVDHTWVAAVEKQLQEEGADLFAAQLGADIASELEAGHEVAYSALSTQEGYEFSRVAAGEDMIEGSEIVVTDDEVYGGQFVAAEEGFAVRSFDATAEVEDDEDVVEGESEEAASDEEEGKVSSASITFDPSD